MRHFDTSPTGMIPHTHLTEAFAEQECFGRFNSLEPAECNQLTTRDTRRQTGGCRFVPVRQPQKPPGSTDSVLAEASLEQRAAYPILARSLHSRTVIVEIIEVGPVADMRETKASRERHERRIQVCLAPVASGDRIANKLGIA